MDIENRIVMLEARVEAQSKIITDIQTLILSLVKNDDGLVKNIGLIQDTLKIILSTQESLKNMMGGGGAPGGTIPGVKTKS